MACVISELQKVVQAILEQMSRWVLAIWLTVFDRI
jgi:hypothetical protein